MPEQTKPRLTTFEERKARLLELVDLPPDTTDADLILTRTLETTMGFFSNEQRERMLTLLSLPLETQDPDLVMASLEDLAQRANAAEREGISCSHRQQK